MVIILQSGILAKDWTGMRVFDIRLDRHQTFLAHLAKNFEEHGEQINIQRLENFEPLKIEGKAPTVFLMYLMSLPAMKPPTVRPTIATYSSGTHKASRLPELHRYPATRQE